jgi:hypothetical protein
MDYRPTTNHQSPITDNLYLSLMLINPTSLQHWINNFYGYGSWEAPIWFVAFEEGGGDLPEDVADKLEYFSKVHINAVTPTLCDLREAYAQVKFREEGPKAKVYKTLFDYRFGERAIQNGIWKNLIAFVHGYRQEEIPDLMDYQRHSFASPTLQQEALLKLYPLPSPHNHSWYYSWLDLPDFKFLKSRAQYKDTLYPNRILTILKAIQTHRPEVVLMYSMSNINALKASVQQVFPDAEFQMVKAIKNQIPQHHRTNLGRTFLLITTQIPTLRHNRSDTGFDWFRLGTMLR